MALYNLLENMILKIKNNSAKAEAQDIELTQLENSINNITNIVYPIGSVYISVNDTSPAELFGGTWEQIEDVFLLASGSNAVGATGGEAEHILTIDEMPSHYHTSHGISIATTGNQVNLALRSTTLGNQHTGNVEMRVASTGGGTAHNNMPPYLTVHMWKRFA